MFQTIKSTQDDSVNFIKRDFDGWVECRYVRRSPEYFCVYLSSQTGCNRGCKFCHLTATQQTSAYDVNTEGFLEQAQTVLRYSKSQPKAKEVNFNWMARGEPLANRIFLGNARPILEQLYGLANKYKVAPKFNISTIFPKTFKQSLVKTFRHTPTFYYSLYSMNKDFREKWIPGAMDPEKALDLLADYQAVTRKIVMLHWAFIDGENDSLEDLDRIVKALDVRGLIVDFNLVRYNPFSNESQESPFLARNLEYMQENIRGKAKMVSRVGLDVKASCGTFIS